MIFDALELPFRGERPHVHRIIQRGSDFERARAFGECREKPVRDRPVYEDALDRDADLAGRREAALDGAIDSRVQVAIRQNDHRVLAAEFEGAADQAFRRLPATSLPVRVLPVNMM